MVIEDRTSHLKAATQATTISPKTAPIGYGISYQAKK
jgi:hypothetical protein